MDFYKQIVIFDCQLALFTRMISYNHKIISSGCGLSSSNMALSPSQGRMYELVYENEMISILEKYKGSYNPLFDYFMQGLILVIHQEALLVITVAVFSL
ncbi:hypothetical protein QQP08_002135 [Theobroma cacao]|nr:hypothetical protein QQP08_002135 [Theobroma cacao]